MDSQIFKKVCFTTYMIMNSFTDPILITEENEGTL